MRACNDIEFLSNYWQEAKSIAEQIKKELPVIMEMEESKKGSLQTVQYTEIGQSWSPSDLMQLGESKNLEVLSRKLADMIHRGRAHDIKPMLKSIVSGKIKVWNCGGYSHPTRNKRREKKKNFEVVEFHETEGKYYEGKQEFIFGHFRWDFKGHVLTAQEIDKIKGYFYL